MITIQSAVHDYTVEVFGDFSDVLGAVSERDRAYYLIDELVADRYSSLLISGDSPARTVTIRATEEQKSFDALSPIFLRLLQLGLKRDGLLVVIGGGILQDIGCFISSVLFRGLRWELIPTTLLAQADSCIGSKSSINIGQYKNQIGTFYPPNRVLITPSVLRTLTWDDIRSGFGEIIKLQLLKGEAAFADLMRDVSAGKPDTAILAKWVKRSLAVKQPYIEADEYDRGIRNLLNYGHTFAHAYESATHYRIPHGIAVTIGLLTATYVSRRLDMASPSHYSELKTELAPWFSPYGEMLKSAPRQEIFRALRHDKKNAHDGIYCILTRGPGRMEKCRVQFEETLVPAVNTFIDEELS